MKQRRIWKKEKISAGQRVRKATRKKWRKEREGEECQ